MMKKASCLGIIPFSWKNSCSSILPGIYVGGIHLGAITKARCKEERRRRKSSEKEGVGVEGGRRRRAARGKENLATLFRFLP